MNKKMWGVVGSATVAIVIGLAIFLFQSGSKNVDFSWQEQYDLGVRYLSEGNYEEAVIAFTASIEIDEKQPDTYMKLAEAYIAMGDIESAKNILKQGIDATGEESLSILLKEISDRESALWPNDSDMSFGESLLVVFEKMRQSVVTGNQDYAYELLFEVYERLGYGEEIENDILMTVQKVDNTEIATINDSDPYRIGEYDAFGFEVRRHILISGNSYVYYDYDNQGNRVKEISVSDGYPNVVYYNYYDNQGELIAQVYYGYGSNFTDIWVYNEDGEEVASVCLHEYDGSIINEHSMPVRFSEYEDDNKTIKREIRWWYNQECDGMPIGMYDIWENGSRTYYNPNGTVIR